jgi:tetratricopeptide (TPR) repeat protein
MSIESLKQQARKHEQNEDWKKALDQYNKALAELAREEQVDIGLYNRVGDLHVRVGQLDQAVEHYERAVELYREAYLPNNAIAVCKKIIRNLPDRHKAYLQIGQIRAEQGFLPDARTHFLTYAERMQKAGDLDESFRALIEFCDLAPDDVGVRITVADQMVANRRSEEAVEQLVIAHRHLTQIGEIAQAKEVETRILGIDPEADLSALPSMDSVGGIAGGGYGDIVPPFGEVLIGSDVFRDGEEEEVDLAVTGATEEAVGDSEDEAEVDADLGGFEISSGDDDAGEVEEEAAELPTMDFGDDAAEEEAAELPTMDFEGEEVEEEAAELPIMDFADEGAEEEAAELPTMDFADEGAEEGAAELPIMDFGDEGAEEEVVELPTMDFEEVADSASDDSETVEVASDVGASDSGGDAAESMEEAVEEAGAETPVEAHMEESATVGEGPEEDAEEATGGPPDDGYVDLGAMILGDSEKKSTRFTVAYEEPTGNEDADFARMLSQFKDKVSENLDTSDVRAHYDLGTAYKEMGLLDEAISSFQTALRASSDHLPTYELMGQTFLEMGQPEAAVKSLKRALESEPAVEDELVGIYYYLARAYEALDDRESAVDFYDRVFALDINFADVTERLRELR